MSPHETQKAASFPSRSAPPLETDEGDASPPAAGRLKRTPSDSLVHFLASESYTYAAGDGGGLFEERTTQEKALVDSRPLMASRRQPKKLSVTKACVSTFKAFIGSGILLMPQAFTNAGWGLALLLSTFSAMISIVGILLLGECHHVCQQSYPEIARTALGGVGYFLVAFSIALSQFCFCVCFMVFTQSTVSQIFATHHLEAPPGSLVLASTALICVPLGWIRRIGKMKYPVLVGDAIIVAVVLYVAYVAITRLATNGLAPGVLSFRVGERALTFFGTSIYMFEGIGLVIPIRESMREPEHFSKVLGGMMAFFLVLLAGFGAVGYLAWGPEVQTVVLNELPGNLGTVAQAGYIVALICGYPLIIYPTFSICEASIFGSMPPSRRRQALKNLFRSLLTAFMAVFARLIAEDLSTFVSIVGVFCCIPLAFILPAMLHLRIIGSHPIKCWGMIVIGGILVPLTLYVNLSTWGS